MMFLVVLGYRRFLLSRFLVNLLDIMAKTMCSLVSDSDKNCFFSREMAKLFNRLFLDNGENLVVCLLENDKNHVSICWIMAHPQGLILTPAAGRQFESGEHPMSFAFVVADIQEIRPIVRVSPGVIFHIPLYLFFRHQLLRM